MTLQWNLHKTAHIWAPATPAEAGRLSRWRAEVHWAIDRILFARQPDARVGRVVDYVRADRGLP